MAETQKHKNDLSNLKIFLIEGITSFFTLEEQINNLYILNKKLFKLISDKEIFKIIKKYKNNSDFLPFDSSVLSKLLLKDGFTSEEKVKEIYEYFLSKYFQEKNVISIENDINENELNSLVKILFNRDHFYRLKIKTEKLSGSTKLMNLIFRLVQNKKNLREIIWKNDNIHFNNDTQIIMSDILGTVRKLDLLEFSLNIESDNDKKSFNEFLFIFSSINSMEYIRKFVLKKFDFLNSDILKNFLMKNKIIQELSIDANFFRTNPLNYINFCKGIESNHTIKSLKISNFKLDSLEEKDLFHFSSCLKNNLTLESLDLSRNFMNNNINLLDQLKIGLEGNKSIKRLNLSNNSLGYNLICMEKLANLIKDSKFLEEINLSNSYFNEDEVNFDFLYDGFEQNKLLKVLEIRNERLGINRLSFKKLMNGLKNNLLQEICFSEIRIADNVLNIQYLTDLIKESKNLKKLSLINLGYKEYNLEDRPFLELGECLKNSSITHLNISENEILFNNSFDKLIDLLSSKQFVSLNFDKCKLFNSIHKMEKFFEILKKQKNLKELFIKSNVAFDLNYSSEEINHFDSLYDFIKTNSLLETLYFPNNGLFKKKENILLISKSLKKSNLKKLDISQNQYKFTPDHIPDVLNLINSFINFELVDISDNDFLGKPQIIKAILKLMEMNNDLQIIYSNEKNHQKYFEDY